MEGKTGWTHNRLSTVEIRKTLNLGVSLTLIVSLGTGYKYKNYQPPGVRRPGHYGSYKTEGVNVHMALNGGGQLTFAEMVELQEAVQEARVVLENLPR